MLHRISEKITSYYIRKNKINQDEKDTYEYCFEVLLSTVINLLAIIILAVITKLYIETLCFTIFFMTLRGSSGGFHAKTHLGCFIGLLIVYSVLPISYLFISTEILQFISIAFMVAGSLMIFIFAPVDNINNPFTRKMKRRFRIKSIIFTLLTIAAYCSLIAFKSTIRYAYAISYVSLAVALSLVVGIIKNLLHNRQAHCKIVEYLN